MTEEIQDELRWDMAFKKKQPQLVAAARKAKQEIAQGLSEPMDYKRLGETHALPPTKRHPQPA
jgi:hypothetical protein